MNEIYVLRKQQYVICKSIAEHIKAHLSIWNKYAGTIQ